jgi:hypothetical protein
MRDLPFLDLRLDESSHRATELASAPEFLLRCLLGAREEAALPSNEAGFDEDVNVYLVGLLQSLLSAAFHERARQLYFPHDLDLARAVRRMGDDRFAYRVYRSNADHLLLAVGLFHHVEGAGRPFQPVLHRQPEEFIGRGGTYYCTASNLLRRLRRQPSGVETALNKLGRDFERYVQILRRVRTSYFHLSARLSEGVLFHLLQASPEDNPAELDASHRYDAFLDAFSSWKQHRDADAWERLAARVEELKSIDADFRFQMPQPEEILDAALDPEEFG